LFASHIGIDPLFHFADPAKKNVYSLYCLDRTPAGRAGKKKKSKSNMEIQEKPKATRALAHF
jgi:hypothetical protein